MSAHPHAENMRLYAEDAAETDKPELRWEFSVDDGASWETVPYNHPSWLPQAKYRRKQNPLECWVVKRGPLYAYFMDKDEAEEFLAARQPVLDSRIVHMREVTA